MGALMKIYGNMNGPNMAHALTRWTRDTIQVTKLKEVVDYFNTTVTLFKTLSTFDILAEAGVTPEKGRVWTLNK